MVPHMDRQPGEPIVPGWPQAPDDYSSPPQYPPGQPPWPQGPKRSRSRLSIVSVVVTGVVLVIGALVALVVVRAKHDLDSSDHSVAEASKLCTKGGYGALGLPIPAKDAVAMLRAAGMSAHPWDGLPTNALIVLCPGGFNDLAGVFLDACGQHTPAPTPSGCPAAPSTTPGPGSGTYGHGESRIQCSFFWGFPTNVSSHIWGCEAAEKTMAGA